MEEYQEKLLAFNAAKEIVIAKMATTSSTTNKDSGQATGEYFEALYQKLLDFVPHLTGNNQ